MNRLQEWSLRPMTLTITIQPPAVVLAKFVIGCLIGFALSWLL
jgi:hypothetical protein